MQRRRLSFLGYLNKNICSSRLLLWTLSFGLIFTLPTILGLSLILGWVLHWLLLCLSWSLFSRLPWSDLYWSMGAAHCLYKLEVGSQRFLGMPMHNDMYIARLAKLHSHMIGIFFKEVLRIDFSSPADSRQTSKTWNGKNPLMLSQSLAWTFSLSRPHRFHYCFYRKIHSTNLSLNLKTSLKS